MRLKSLESEQFDLVFGAFPIHSAKRGKKEEFSRDR
jgi:hypothetical protein